MKLHLELELQGGCAGDLTAECRSFLKALAEDPGFFSKLTRTGQAGRELHLLQKNKGHLKTAAHRALIANPQPHLRCAANITGRKHGSRADTRQPDA